MANVTGTNGNDILFFSGDLGHLTTTLVNAYSGESVLIDDDFNINNSTYEGLAGIDTLFMTNVGDALFITDGVGTQVFANIERIIAGDGGDVIVLSHDTITLGDIFIDGGRANDVIWGNVGNDTIRGFDGDDNIDGGAGNDLILGQNDNDYINGGRGNDNIDGGAGIDTASYAGMPGAAVINLLTGVALDGSGGTDTLTGIENAVGSSFSDTIIGGASANVLNGGAGNDILTGGAGNDTLIGGADVDTADYSASTASVIVNLDTGTATDGLGGTDTLSGIENVIGTAFDDVLTGDAEANVLTGGAGNDVLAGGAGNDTLNGGIGIDRADYGAATAGVTVDMAAGTANDGMGGTDTLSAIENVNGSAFNDILSGGAGVNILNGAGGDDILTGGVGNDTLDGGADNDTADYSAAAAGVMVDLAAGIATDGAGGIDTLISIENAHGSAFADNLSGDVSDNALHGGAGNDVLAGSAGNDTLDGGADIDIADYSAAAAGVMVALDTGTANDGSGGTDILSNIENVIGSAFADTLTGDANENILSGAAGDDTLSGGTGNDTLDGGADVDTVDYSAAVAGVTVDLASGIASDGSGGTDTLSNIENVNGSAFADVLTGDASDNALHGGAGNDILIGNAGDDTLDGGADNDTADYSAAAAGVTANLAAGTASDGSGGTDTLTGIENLTGSSFADMLTGDANANVLAGNAGDDVLNGGDGNDDLSGGVSSDLLEGGNGDDVLHFSADIIYDGGTMAYNAGSPGIEGTGETKSASGSNGSFDVFNGGAGFDTLVMTGGNDTLFLWDDINPVPAGGSEMRVSGIEQIDAGAGNDIVDFTHEDYAYGDVIMNGGDGNDYLWASSGNDTLDGGNDNDNLYGGVGNDTLYGGNGDDVIIGGPDEDSGAVVTTTQSHQFSNDVVFPNVTECVSIMDLVPPGDNALGIAAGDLSVSYSTTAEISFVQTVAGYSNSLGFYNISQDGTIGGVTLAFPNVKNYDAGDAATINLPGAPDQDFGFFIISDGASKNNFNTFDLVNGTLDFVYMRNSAHERAATIYDSWNKIDLVYTKGSVEKVLKGDIFHTTERGGDTNLNSDGDVHVVSGVINNGDSSRLRIGFEDLKHVGDADYNDVVFDVTVASRQTGATLVVDDHDILYGGAGNDVLDGGVGDDVLFGGEGADTLYGGHGCDQFVFDVMDGFADTVKDFALGAGGDVLNITDILQGYDAMSDAISDFVRLVNSGGNTQLQVNEDGDAGGSFAAVAIIEGGVGSATLADLINNGNLVANQPPVM